MDVITDSRNGECRFRTYPKAVRPPRGVLLLLILALLALFGLMAVAFIVVSGHAKRNARSIERLDMVSDPPPKLLHQAAMQVLSRIEEPILRFGTA